MFLPVEQTDIVAEFLDNNFNEKVISNVGCITLASTSGKAAAGRLSYWGLTSPHAKYFITFNALYSHYLMLRGPIARLPGQKLYVTKQSCRVRDLN